MIKIIIMIIIMIIMMIIIIEMIIKGKIRLNISGGCGESGRTQFVGSLEKSRGQFK